MNENFIKKTEIYDSLMVYKKKYNFDGYSFGEVFYHYINKLEPIKCSKDYCNNKPTYESIFRGYRKYCSNKCKSNDKEWRDKVEKTNLAKYGVKNPFQSKEIQEKIKKTLIETLGVDNPSKCNIIKEKIEVSKSKLNQDDINKKREDTCLIKYGQFNVSQSKIIKDKISNKTKKNWIDKKLKNKVRKSTYHKLNRIKLLESCNLSLINYDDETDIISVISNKCNHSFDTRTKTISNRKSNNVEQCLICTPLNSFKSTPETAIYEFIKENYNGTIIRLNKSILDGKELDIYLPELNLAFEHNGLYWHCEKYYNNKYHMEKTNNCLKKGIKLIHIWGDDWIYRKDIVKSRILNLLNKSNRIWARKCIIMNINNKDANIFYSLNHIQGNIMASKYNVGLFYNNELVSLMSFGSYRKNLNHKKKANSYELTRFCNKINTSVIGAASKLFTYFVKTYDPLEILSCADRSWSNGDLYDKIGFNFLHNTKENYYYIIDGMRQNRFLFQKHKLVKEGFDKSKTEHQIMLDRKIFRVYDSGSKIYIWNKKGS